MPVSFADFMKQQNKPPESSGPMSFEDFVNQQQAEEAKSQTYNEFPSLPLSPMKAITKQPTAEYTPETFLPAAFKAAAPKPATPSRPSQPEKQKQIQQDRAQAAEFFEGNPIGEGIRDYVLEPVAGFLDKLRFNNAAGRFVDRASQTAAETAGQPRIYDPVSTGSKVADNAADVAGAIGSLALPGLAPAAPISRTGSLLSAAYNNPLAQRAGSLAASRISNPLGRRVAEEAGREAVAGAAIGTALPLMRGENDPAEIAKSAAIDAGLGAVGGVAGPLIGRGINSGAGKISEIYNQMVQESPVSRFSAFTKQVGEKLKRPKEVREIGDLIDVGGRPEKEGGNWWQRIRTNVVDELEPLRQATQRIGGKNVPTAQNPFKQAWLSRGWKGKADTKLEYGIMDASGQKVGKSLKEVLEPLQGNLAPLRKYAVALRSLEYDKAGLESGVSKEMAQETIERLGTPEMLKVHTDLQQYITGMNQSTLVDSGIWSEEKLLKLRKEQPNYIPMFRTQEKGIRDFPHSTSNKRFANQKDPTKRRTGSTRPIVDPIESIIKQTYKNTAIAEKNKVVSSFYDLAEANPDNGIIEPIKGRPSAMESVQKSLDEFLMNPSDDFEKQLKESLQLFEPQTVDGKRNVFTFMRNGKPVQMQVNDDQLAKVLAGLNVDQSGTVVNWLGKMTGILKRGLVLAPDFVVKNLLRDQMSAFINSKYGYLPVWDMISGLASAMKRDKFFYDWMNSGGANGAWVSLERDYLQDQIRKLTQPGIRKIKQNPINFLEKLSEFSEQATRLGEFKKGRKKGASKQDAALASRDVTLDFSRIGTKTKDVNKAVAFFNVAIQSLDKMLRQFKEHPVKTATKAGISITLPSVLLYLLHYDKPWYQELPQWEKDTYWHIPVGNEIVKIPKPFELGIIFGTFMERMLQDMMTDDPKAFEGFAGQIVNGFTPSIIPTMFVPWIEAFANKDSFTKAPIVPRREADLRKEDQFGPYTSEIAKFAGRVTGQSPRIIENTITGYTGTLGRYALQAADNALEMSGAVDRPPKPETGLASKPISRTFFSKSLEGSSRSVDQFYNERERLRRERNSARKNDRPFKEEKKYQLYNKIGNAISDLQAAVRNTLESRDMTPEEKRERIQALNLRIINLARRAKGEKPIER